MLRFLPPDGAPASEPAFDARLSVDIDVVYVPRQTPREGAPCLANQAGSFAGKPNAFATKPDRRRVVPAGKCR